jgi:hypothetical protein
MLRFLAATSSTAPEIYRYKRRARKHMTTERGLIILVLSTIGIVSRNLDVSLELLSVCRGLYVYTVLLKAAILNT